jgi:hypothetical protein
MTLDAVLLKNKLIKNNLGIATAEFQVQSGMSCFETLPPTKLHESSRNKHVHSLTNGESEAKEENDDLA